MIEHFKKLLNFYFFRKELSLSNKLKLFDDPKKKNYLILSQKKNNNYAQKWWYHGRRVILKWSL